MRLFPFLLFLYIQRVTSFQKATPLQSCRKNSQTIPRLASCKSSYLDKQRVSLINALREIDDLNSKIQKAQTDVELSSQVQSILGIERSLDELLFQTLPPIGMAPEDFITSMKLFLLLPPKIRLSITRFLEMDDAAAKDFYKIPEIISKLYDRQASLKPQLLAEALSNTNRRSNFNDTDGAGRATSYETEARTDKKESNEELQSTARTLLGRIGKSEDKFPTSKDLDVLTEVIDSSTYAISGKPLKIPGGYLIPGQNRKRTVSELLESLDSRFPTDWEFTVSYIPDFTESSEDALIQNKNALLLHRKDFTPKFLWLYSFSTISAVFSTLSFGLGIFGSNTAYLDQLGDAISQGDYTGVNLFCGKVFEFVLPLCAILFSHELGHEIVARKGKIQRSSRIPSFVPFFNSLPMLGGLTRITASPQNLTSLFDFAVAGPLLGFIASFAFLLAGILATQTQMSSGTVETLLPALPVGVLKMSTLGGSIVDILYGGSGFMTSQDDTTPIPLHPFFIAGFCGLLINAIELLPLGATDGGRLSLSIFGRRGHAVIGALTWFLLLVLSLTLDGRQGEILVGAWVINNILENDMEIPCRDETVKVDAIRVVAGFCLWFLAVLTLVPAI